MKHDFRTCREDDCDECQFLVDSGRLCSCDYCGEMLDKETHGYRVIDGLIYHNICIKYVMTPEKECYNQLLAIFLDYPEENREDFLEILNSLENRNLLVRERVIQLESLLNFDDSVKIQALRQLIKIFEIKRKPVGLSGTFITGSYTMKP